MDGIDQWSQDHSWEAAAHAALGLRPSARSSGWRNSTTSTWPSPPNLAELEASPNTALSGLRMFSKGGYCPFQYRKDSGSLRCNLNKFRGCGVQGDTDQFLIRERHLRGNRAYGLEQELRPELVVSCRKKASTFLAGWTAS